MTSSVKPKLFISYAHSSQEHETRVEQFAAELRSAGLQVTIDTDVKSPAGPKELWPRWMKNKMKEADWVLICVCKKYRSRFDGELDDDRGHGVVFEGCIVTNTLYRGEMKNLKYIPILFKQTDHEFVPDELVGATCYLIPDKQNTLIAKILEFAKNKPTTDPPQEVIGPGIHDPPPPSQFDDWREETVIRFADLLFSLRNEKRRHKVLDLFHLPHDAERDAACKSLEEFLRTHSDSTTFNLEKPSLIIAELDWLRTDAGSASAESETLRSMQDLLLPLCLSPAIKHQVATHMANHGAALISEAVALEVGAELAVSVADGRSPEYRLNDEGKIAGIGLLKFVKLPPGDPSPDSLADAILQELAGQLSVNLDADICDEADVRKRIEASCKRVQLAFRVHRTRRKLRYYCIVKLPADKVLRDKLIDVLRDIRTHLPDLVFFELFQKAAGREGEEIVMQILKSRFPNGGTR